MSESLEKPWSNNTNAPQIPLPIYFLEKGYLAGTLIGAMAYGIIVVLFFRCIGALLNPVNRMDRGFKWVLVAHTVAMFSFVTMPIAMDFNRRSISYIDNRDFPLGPTGYGSFSEMKTADLVSRVMFPMNQWLADGLLLYRCWIIYSSNCWVIAFPCLMYFAAIAMGITYIYETSLPGFIDSDVYNDTFMSFSTISLSLNVILMLMIVARLILHRRNIKKAVGSLTGTSGIYMSIIAMLVESYAIYDVTFLLYIGTSSGSSYAATVFAILLGETQVIAPFLVTLRVAHRRALTSEMVTSGDIGSIHFKSHGESVDDGETLPEGDGPCSKGASRETLGQPDLGAENAVEEIS